MSAWALMLLAACNLALTGCGGSSWPSVRAHGDPDFLHGGRAVGSVDILPVDVQLWTHSRSRRSPQAIAEEFDQLAVGIVSGQLAGRGYHVNALGWDGKYIGQGGLLAEAMPPDQIAETVHALSGYGEALRRSRGAPLSPHLPHRLGEQTRADATLYIGGWAYAGNDRSGETGKKVLKGVAIALFIAVIVVAVVLAAKSGSKGGGDGGGGASGVARGAGKAAGGALRVAGRAVGGLTRVAIRTTAHLAHAASNINLVIVDDCYGRDATHVAYYAERPDYYQQQTVPRSGRSAMLIEMTLVDNRTGEALWHAHQRFRASAEKPAQIQRALGDMLATVPIAQERRPGWKP